MNLGRIVHKTRIHYLSLPLYELPTVTNFLQVFSTFRQEADGIFVLRFFSDNFLYQIAFFKGIIKLSDNQR